jgi:hypothetical protein
LDVFEQQPNGDDSICAALPLPMLEQVPIGPVRAVLQARDAEVLLGGSGDLALPGQVRPAESDQLKWHTLAACSKAGD